MFEVRSHSIMRGAATVYSVINTETGIPIRASDHFWAFPTEHDAQNRANSLNEPQPDDGDAS
jgi:hypothetical protein